MRSMLARTSVREQGYVVVRSTSMAGARARSIRSPRAQSRARRATLAALASLGAALLPCCLLVTSTDGLSGGPGVDGAAPADAGLEANEASADAPGDANAPVPEAGCGAGELFCADFDQGAFDLGWTNLGTGVGTMVADPAAFISAPRSLLVTLPNTTGYTQAIALTKRIQGVYTSFRCSFRVRRDAVGTTQITFAKLVSFTNTDQVTLLTTTDLTAGSFGVLRFDGTSGVTTPQYVTAPLTFDPSEWHLVAFEIDRTSGALSIDGNPIATLAHGAAGTAVRVELTIGGVEMDKANTLPWKVRYDDVRCARTP